MNYTKYLSDSVDNIISRLIGNIDSKVSINQDLIQDIVQLQEFDIDGAVDEATTKNFLMAILKLVAHPEITSNGVLKITARTNYGETGEGSGILTSSSCLAFPATNDNRLNDSTYLFIQFNDDRTISLVSQGVGVDAWFEIFKVDWEWTTDSGFYLLDWARCNWNDFVTSYPINQYERRFDFKNRLGSIINPYYLLQSSIMNCQPVIILREALDLARSRDFSNASLSARCLKLGNYNEWTGEAQKVFDEVSATMSSGNPYAIIKLVQHWFENSNVSEDDPSFSESPPMVKAFCLSAAISVGIQVASTIVSFALTMINGVLGIVASVIGGIISTIWNVVSTTAGSAYKLVWGDNGSNDTDSRSIDIPFSRGYFEIPYAMKEMIQAHKILNIHVPGCEIVIRDNNNLTDNLACYEMRPSLNWNLGTHLTKHNGYYTNSLLTFKRISSTETTVSLSNTLTLDQMVELTDQFYDPLTLFRDVKDEEIEMRVSSAILVFGLWLLHYSAGQLRDKTISYSAEGATSRISLAGNSSISTISLDLLNPILTGLIGLAINVKDVDLNNYIQNSESGFFEPVYQSFVNPQFSDLILNYLISLSSLPYDDGNVSNSIAITSEWFTANLDIDRNAYFQTQGIYNKLLTYNYGDPWSEINPRPTFDTPMYSRGVFNKTFTVVHAFRNTVEGPIIDSVITGSYKGVPFCTAPEYNSVAIISAIAIGAAVIAAVSIGLAVGFNKLKRSVARKQLSMQKDLEKSRNDAITAASSGSKQEFNSAYKKYKRQSNRYNWMSKVSGMPKYNKDTGFYESNILPNGKYGTDILPTYSSLSGIEDTTITVDIIYALICGRPID